MLKKTDINFGWKYSADFREEYINPSFDDSSFEEVQIPHANIEIPYNNFDEKMYQFESCYRKELFIHDLAEEERVFIKFEAVMTYARVYLNGTLLGEHKGGYTPFRLDLTDAAKAGETNCLTVLVDSREREDIPPFGFVVDYLTFGGIYREVSLEYVSSVHMEHVGIRTEQVLTPSPLLHMDLYMHNGARKKESLSCRAELLLSGQSIRSFEKGLSLKGDLQEKIELCETLESVRLWDLETPHLYHLKVELIREGKCIDTQMIRFGFREIEFNSSGFHLNGRRVKIQGLNRHQSFPYVGYAMPRSAQYRDAEILKYELGVNTVRLSHYPQSNHFMDRCDELGLLVFDEIPGWQHIGEKEWQDVALENVREMILKDMNHPSVFIWGVRINESQDHDELYARTNALARSLDSSRPTGGVRCIMKSNLLEDVYTYNDFVHTGKNQGLDRKKKVTGSDKGYLITEYNGHMFPTKKFDHESKRVDHALRHLNVIQAMQENDDISGAIGWCMFDYNTHKDFGSGDKICYHGVMDMFRIPKTAAYVYQSQQDRSPVMHVAASLNIGEFEASLLEDIRIFTNCDYVKFYKNGTLIKSFYPRKDLYPNVEHPPVIIDDFIGDAIRENEKFSPADAVLVKKLLTRVSKNGVNLGVLDTLKMGWIFLKYRMNARDAEDLYTKYFGGWGGAAAEYLFEGYINDECVVKTEKKHVFKPELTLQADSDTLIEDTSYDTGRMIVRLIDESGNDIVYAHEAVTVETEGPIRLIGPETLPLTGGSTGFWIRTAGKSGEALVRVKSDRYGTMEQRVKVSKVRQTDQ